MQHKNNCHHAYFTPLHIVKSRQHFDENAIPNRICLLFECKNTQTLTTCNFIGSFSFLIQFLSVNSLQISMDLNSLQAYMCVFNFRKGSMNIFFWNVSTGFKKIKTHLVSVMLNDCNVIKTHNECSRATFFHIFFIGEWRVLKQLQALILLKLFVSEKQYRA